MRWGKFVISLICTVILTYFLSVPMGGIPFALGDFFNPFKGFWMNTTSQSQPFELPNQLPQLKAPVEVGFNQRGVPYIFAENDEDAYFMQGYITARDRLWQMEFQTYVAAGRLSEIMPIPLQETVLPLDREMRRKGIPYAARRSVDGVMEDPRSRNILAAFTAGVNAYIRTLSPSSYPLEYKILGYRPEKWTAYKSCLLLKYMANMLAGRSRDISNTRNLSAWGPAMFDTLFSEPLPVLDPVIPEESPLPDTFFIPPAIPQNYLPDSSWMTGSIPHLPTRNIGSNNWAVAGVKTSTGTPMLANDPHLGLSLPSIWYEVQICVGNEPTYGVSLPGAPGIVIGFNSAIAWGLTNSGRDVLDYYTLKFRDTTQGAYWYKGKWRDVSRKIDTFHLKGGDMFLDTVMYTEFGPVMYDASFGDIPVPLAARWTAYEPGNELLTFYLLNRAKSYKDYVAALSYYVAPAQNFVFASRSGDIAIHQHGKFVNRWKGQGHFILDASDSTHQWHSFLPPSQVPKVLNPQRGFVSSANQRATSQAYPYFYQGRFQKYRNRRLNALLSQEEPIDMKRMKAMQLDNFGLLASEILPVMLGELEPNALTDKERIAYNALVKWDYLYESDEIAPTIFQQWWDTLYTSIWQDEYLQKGLAAQWPEPYTTISLLKSNPNFSFFDDLNTPEKENRRKLVVRAFRAALDQLYTQDNAPENWVWGAFKGTSIRHMARLSPELGRHNLLAGGFKEILNATSKYNGPSWRMVVSLGKEITAEGIYPGGQSGNPASPLYDNGVDDWVEGNYFPLSLLFSLDPEEADIMYQVKITN